MPNKTIIHNKQALLANFKKTIAIANEDRTLFSQESIDLYFMFIQSLSQEELENFLITYANGTLGEKIPYWVTQLNTKTTGQHQNTIDEYTVQRFATALSMVNDLMNMRGIDSSIYLAPDSPKPTTEEDLIRCINYFQNIENYGRRPRDIRSKTTNQKYQDFIDGIKILKIQSIKDVNTLLALDNHKLFRLIKPNVQFNPDFIKEFKKTLRDASKIIGTANKMAYLQTSPKIDYLQLTQDDVTALYHGIVQKPTSRTPPNQQEHTLYDLKQLIAETLTNQDSIITPSEIKINLTTRLDGIAGEHWYLIQLPKSYCDKLYEILYPESSQLIENLKKLLNTDFNVDDPGVPHQRAIIVINKFNILMGLVKELRIKNHTHLQTFSKEALLNTLDTVLDKQKISLDAINDTKENILLLCKNTLQKIEQQKLQSNAHWNRLSSLQPSLFAATSTTTSSNSNKTTLSPRRRLQLRQGSIHSNSSSRKRPSR